MLTAAARASASPAARSTHHATQTFSGLAYHGPDLLSPVFWSLLLPLIFGAALLPWAIGLLAHLGMGQAVRQEGPEIHQFKSGTPTAGGAVVIALLVLTLLILDRRAEVLPVAGAMILGGTLGLFDDVLTVRTQQRGLLARQRIIGQLLIGLVIAVWFARLHLSAQYVPLLGRVEMGFFLVPAGALALAGSANAFNLTDGSDGLAPGVMVLVALALALIAGAHHHHVGLVRMLLATSGALLAFLAYNLPPARVFLGGVGSEGLGMMLAAAGMAVGVMWFLPILALVPVLETLSVAIQVYFFKSQKGRRFFRMSPLHHHFQLGGWSEWRVALTAWAVTAGASGVGWLLAREVA